MKLLAIAAVAEAATGLALLLAPSLVGQLLLGAELTGVAIPVADGGQVLEALDAAASGAITEAARAAFIARHYEPGSASERIANDLLDWLA